MISFIEYLNESFYGAKIKPEKSFVENYKLLASKVNSAIKRLSKKIDDSKRKAFDEKCSEIQTVLRGYEILAKRIDSGEFSKDEFTALKNKFYFLMNFCSKKNI